MKRKNTAAAALLLTLFLTFLLLRIPTNNASQEPHGEEAAARGPLTGVTVAIDPGHGGYDQGCSSKKGTLEAPLNLDVSLRVRELLRDMGAHVIMTREEDTSLVDPTASGNRKRQDMALREDIIKGCEAQIMLSIHMNYYRQSGPSGALVYFREGSEDGESLADAIQSAFYKADNRHNQYARKGDYFVLGTCDAAVLVECGFLSNPTEEALLLTEAYRQNIAEIITRGVLSYWNPL